MGVSLNGLTPAATYSGLIKFGDNSIIGATLRRLSDGAGNDLPIFVSSTQVNFGASGSISAVLGAKGTGTTSATKMVRFENSDNSSSFEVNDAGSLTLISSTSTVFSTGLSGTRTYNINSLGGFGASKVNLTGLMDLHSNDGTIGLRVNDAFTGIQDAVSIGSIAAPNAAALLDLNNTTTKGLLLPKMTDAQITAIAAPPAGLVVYSTTQNVVAFYDGTTWKKVTHTNL